MLLEVPVKCGPRPAHRLGSRGSAIAYGEHLTGHPDLHLESHGPGWLLAVEPHTEMERVDPLGTPFDNGQNESLLRREVVVELGPADAGGPRSCSSPTAPTTRPSSLSVETRSHTRSGAPRHPRRTGPPQNGRHAPEARGHCRGRCHRVAPGTLTACHLGAPCTVYECRGPLTALRAGGCHWKLSRLRGTGTAWCDRRRAGGRPPLWGHPRWTIAPGAQALGFISRWLRLTAASAPLGPPAGGAGGK